uniref:(northern house mosquito) hypothetical protein n=1 Tax=Culex pipiens TaxID=7175 RepID=A0A8D8N5S8_CULPI
MVGCVGWEVGAGVGSTGGGGALVGVRTSLLMSSSTAAAGCWGCRTGASTGAGVKSMPERRSRLEERFGIGAATTGWGVEAAAVTVGVGGGCSIGGGCWTGGSW